VLFTPELWTKFARRYYRYGFVGYGAVKTVSVSLTILVLTPTTNPKHSNYAPVSPPTVKTQPRPEIELRRQNKIDNYINY